MPVARSLPRLHCIRPAGSTGLPIQLFLILQMICQLACLVGILGPLRTAFRGAAFALSPAFWVLLPGLRRSHPAARFACGALVVLGLGLLHPLTSNLGAGIGEFGLNLAVLAPLFWVPRVRLDLAGFRRLILTLWAFYTLSASCGVLQVYFPAQFQPRVSPVIRAQGNDYLRGLMITLDNGQQIFRPMGLTDEPGAAAVAGLHAIVFGMGLLLGERHLVASLGYLVAMAIGLFCIYLSQVRSVLIVAALCQLVFAAVLVCQAEWRRFAFVSCLMVVLAVGSFHWATSIGDGAVRSRLSTLNRGSPTQVYYASRGKALEHTFNRLLPKYPLGAGLGRWGMMRYYFGNTDTRESGEVWVEIQWTGWLVDGGAPLIVAYVLALLATGVTAWRIAMTRRRSACAVWGALIFAYDVGALATTFNYPLFVSQDGLEFWLLNASLFAATAGWPKEALPERHAPKDSRRAGPASMAQAA